MYTLKVVIDYRGNYPDLKSLEQYVRSWRHAAEREREKPVQTEQPRRTAGMDFVEAVLSSEVSPGSVFYDGIACTQLTEYLLCFITTAPNADDVRAVPDLDRKFEVTVKSAKE